MEEINIKNIVFGIAMGGLYVFGLVGIVSDHMNHWDKKKDICTDKDYSTKELSKKAMPGVVTISTDKALGSGFVVRHVNNQTLILTNSHVIKGANQITVGWQEGDEDRALVVLDGGDTSTLTDLALLKVDGIEGKVLKLKTDEAIVGEDVIAIGSPRGYEFTNTKGIISSLRESGKLIQTDTAINPGSSGGPLINQSGCVVGVNTLRSNDSVGLNFAISSHTADRFVDKYDPTKPYQNIYQVNQSNVINNKEREREREKEKEKEKGKEEE